jgi:hypothetical protein
LFFRQLLDLRSRHSSCKRMGCCGGMCDCGVGRWDGRLIILSPHASDGSSGLFNPSRSPMRSNTLHSELTAVVLMS